MIRLSTRTSLLWAASLCLAAPIAVFAQDGEEWSPFQSPQAQSEPQQPQQPQQSPLDKFEFNGVMRIGDQLRISVYDTEKGKNYWISREGSNELGMEWLRYDENGQKVLVGMGGFKKELALKKVKIEPLKIAANDSDPAAPVEPNRPTTGVAAPPPANVSQESDEEVRERMRRVAEEIRRRRAERRARIEERRSGE